MSTYDFLENGFEGIDGYSYSSDIWQDRKSRIGSFLENGRRVTEEIKKGNTKYDEDWLHIDFREVKRTIDEFSGRWDRFFISQYQKVKKWAEDIEEIFGIRSRLKNFTAEHEEMASQLMGHNWKKWESNWDEFEKTFRFIGKINEGIKKGQYEESILDIIDKYRGNYYNGSKLPGLKESMVKITHLVDRIQRSTDFKYDGKGLGCLRFGEFIETIEKWCQSPEKIKPIIDYNKLDVYLRKNGLGLHPILDRTLKSEMTAKDMNNLLRLARYKAVLIRAKTRFGSIVAFNAMDYDGKVKMFQKYEKLEMEYNKALVLEAHAERILDYHSRTEQRLREYIPATEKSKPSIRKSFASFGEEILQVKPVVMMNPLSVATYIPPESIEFDLVIFDEASQIPPEDAMGSILRGRKSIVIGDPKQLPPTDFFKTIVGEDEDEGDESADYQSILDLFLGRPFKDHMLLWHYRSKHESLIHVSNGEFYDSSLIVVSSPNYGSKDLGLKFNLVKEGSYDRGGTRQNEKEAEAVAKKAMKHAREKGRESLGIATFSKAQQDKIEEKLDIFRSKDRSCESFFKSEDSFFIKNLETVQGDERDVIFVSLGYGKDANGKLSRNFGPINRKGGEKRLNVIMTRARKRCELFANFSPNEMKSYLSGQQSPNKNIGILYKFMEYAKTGRIESKPPPQRPPDSAFEIDVCKEIEKMGYRVTPQIPSCEFYIDLAVHHPGKSGVYVLGVECDGATYHRTRWAKIRDRIREDILKKNGWKIYRIWSTDWFNSRENEIEKLQNAIKESISNYEE